jgi:ATP-dependent DNA helicase Rep
VPPWSEFCILFRGNHQSRALEKALQLLRIPYHLTGGTAFLDRGEVKDALSWLRLLANPDDDAAFLRAVQSPNRGSRRDLAGEARRTGQHAHLPLSRAAESMGCQAVAAARGECAAGRSPTSSAACAPTRARCRRRNWCASSTNARACSALRAQCKDEAQFQRAPSQPGRTGRLVRRADRGPGRTRRAAGLLSHADKDDAGNQVR